jgi:catechol 2,3-dioxygenase-like lactoylglutathione lyase family enzyme
MRTLARGSKGETMRRHWVMTVVVLTASLSPARAESKEGGSVLANADVVAFIGATDPTRAKGFYQDKLGLRLASEEPSHALVFDAGGTMLRVSLVKEVSLARYTVLGWKVKDIGVAVDGLVAKGVAFERFAGFTQDERGVWTAPDGTRVAWLKDPDGNVLSLTQFSAEPPSKKQ